jgi:hypothetical protein
MSRMRRMLVGVVAIASLLAIEGTVYVAAPDSAGSVSATRWCC